MNDELVLVAFIIGLPIAYVGALTGRISLMMMVVVMPLVAMTFRLVIDP